MKIVVAAGSSGATGDATPFGRHPVQMKAGKLVGNGAMPVIERRCDSPVDIGSVSSVKSTN